MSTNLLLELFCSNKYFGIINDELFVVNRNEDRPVFLNPYTVEAKLLFKNFQRLVNQQGKHLEEDAESMTFEVMRETFPTLFSLLNLNDDIEAENLKFSVLRISNEGIKCINIIGFIKASQGNYFKILSKKLIFVIIRYLTSFCAGEIPEVRPQWRSFLHAFIFDDDAVFLFRNSTVPMGFIILRQTYSLAQSQNTCLIELKRLGPDDGDELVPVPVVPAARQSIPTNIYHMLLELCYDFPVALPLLQRDHIESELSKFVTSVGTSIGFRNDVAMDQVRGKLLLPLTLSRSHHQYATVKGGLLHGEPGTGKNLTAIQFLFDF
jgi:hypothetical protein